MQGSKMLGFYVHVCLTIGEIEIYLILFRFVYLSQRYCKVQ